MKRAHEVEESEPNKKIAEAPKPKAKQFAKAHTQKHSRLFTHTNVRGILLSCIQNREGFALTEITKLLDAAKEALKDEFPQFESFMPISTSIALDEGKELHHQQEYYHHMKKEEEIEVEDKKAKTSSSFQFYDSGCQGLLFVGFRHEIDPVPFVARVMQLLLPSTSDGKKLKWPKESVIERIVPIQRTCAATIPNILEKIKPMVEQHLSEEKEPITWGIVTHHRNNKEINRKLVIDTVAALVPAKHPVNLSNPSLTIIVEIIKSTCCITFTTDFHSYNKYNPSIYIQQHSETSKEPNTDHKNGQT